MLVCHPCSQSLSASRFTVPFPPALAPTSTQPTSSLSMSPCKVSPPPGALPVSSRTSILEPFRLQLPRLPQPTSLLQLLPSKIPIPLLSRLRPQTSTKTLLGSWKHFGPRSSRRPSVKSASLSLTNPSQLLAVTPSARAASSLRSITTPTVRSADANCPSTCSITTSRSTRPLSG